MQAPKQRASRQVSNLVGHSVQVAAKRVDDSKGCCCTSTFEEVMNSPYMGHVESDDRRTVFCGVQPKRNQKVAIHALFGGWRGAGDVYQHAGQHAGCDPAGKDEG